jgi:signal transduction histidine kinase/ligand-binding sensor domain-containing protein
MAWSGVVAPHMRRNLTRWCVLACALSVLSLPAAGAAAARAGDARGLALETQFRLPELRHNAFRGKDGAPNGVRALAQTSDGFLWVGTETGLYRFDGVRFDASWNERLPSPSVWSLYADANGDLWIGYLFGGVSRLHQGELTYFPPGGIPSGAVRQFIKTPDGTLWVATTAGLARFDGERWIRVGTAVGYSEERPMLLTIVDSRLEVITATAAFDRDSTDGHFSPISRSGALARRFGMPPGSTWSPTGDTEDLQYEPAQSLVDAAGYFWHSVPGALARVRWSPPPNPQPTEELFTVANGLSGEVEALLQDREGNVWVGTMGGLDRFSVAPLHRLSAAENIYLPFLIGEQDGELLLGRFFGPTTLVSHGLRGLRAQPAMGVGVTAATRTRDGAVWTAGMDGLVRHTHGESSQVPPPPMALPALEAMNTSLYQAIAEGPDGDIWLSIATEGLFRLQHGEWSRQGSQTGLPEGPPTRLLADDQGRLWMTYPHNRVILRDGAGVTSYSAGDGLDVGNVLGIAVHRGHVWLSGDHSFATLIGNRFVTVTGRGGERFAYGTGIVESADGELWINGARGIYRVSRDDIAGLLAGTRHEIPFELFDWRDGLTGASVVIRPAPTVLEAADGRLWFSRQNGVWWINPSQPGQNEAPTLVWIESVTGNKSRYVPEADRIDTDLPHNIRIDYTAPVLGNPERVSFKYRLAGVDTDWQEAGTRRQAYYSNLPPGKHRFEVVAANEDGRWSEQKAVLEFRVAAAFYQTVWFRAILVIPIVLFLVLAIVMRTEQIKARIRQQIAARTFERERIARDLHDTLLQGVQSLLFRINTWAKDKSLPGELRGEIHDVAEQARGMIIEGRDRIVLLRNGDKMDSDLMATLADLASERPPTEMPSLEIVAKGESRPLNCEAHQQLVDIAREAVRNAIQHARCRRIQVTAEFRPRSVTLTVADDGCGIAPGVLQEENSVGHFGILGMRERASHLAADFRLGPNGRSGVKVSVQVPAEIAFAGASRRAWWRFSASQ